jgi:hypothetical protein
MGRRSGQQNRNAKRVPHAHVKIATADMDLHKAGALIKPAILYADQVTIFSPAASMAAAIQDVGSTRVAATARRQ